MKNHETSKRFLHNNPKHLAAIVACFAGFVVAFCPDVEAACDELGGDVFEFADDFGGIGHGAAHHGAIVAQLDEVFPEVFVQAIGAMPFETNACAGNEKEKVARGRKRNVADGHDSAIMAQAKPGRASSAIDHSCNLGLQMRY